MCLTQNGSLPRKPPHPFLVLPFSDSVPEVSLGVVGWVLGPVWPRGSVTPSLKACFSCCLNSAFCFQSSALGTKGSSRPCQARPGALPALSMGRPGLGTLWVGVAVLTEHRDTWRPGQGHFRQDHGPLRRGLRVPCGHSRGDKRAWSGRRCRSPCCWELGARGQSHLSASAAAVCSCLLAEGCGQVRGEGRPFQAGGACREEAVTGGGVGGLVCGGGLGSLKLL